MPARRKLTKVELAAIIAEVRQIDPLKPLYPASLLLDCGHWEHAELCEPEMPRYPPRTLCHGCRMASLLYRAPGDNPN